MTSEELKHELTKIVCDVCGQNIGWDIENCPNCPQMQIVHEAMKLLSRECYRKASWIPVGDVTLETGWIPRGGIGDVIIGSN